MKYFLFLSFLFLCPMVTLQSQSAIVPGEKTILDNDKVKVVEYTSLPNGGVCGEGMHHHEPHLTVLITDVKVAYVAEDGKSQDFEIGAGTSLWSESETHSVVNNGNQPTKVLLVFLKE